MEILDSPQLSKELIDKIAMCNTLAILDCGLRLKCGPLEEIVHCGWELRCGRKLFDEITGGIKVCAAKFYIACAPFWKGIEPACPGFDSVGDFKRWELEQRIEQLEVKVQQLMGKSK